MQVYQRKADASARVFHSGRHRDAAGLYLQAYRDAPSSGPNKWHIFHGYTSILREEYFKATDSDISSVSKISSDKSEVKRVRVEAAFTAGFLHWLRHERETACEFYRSAIRIAEKATDKERKIKYTKYSGAGLVPTPMGDLMDDVAKDAANNLHRIGSPTTRMPPVGPQMRSDGTILPPAARFSKVPTEFKKEIVDRLLSVGGSSCDYCGKTSVEAEIKSLLNCSRCKKGFYCSKSCQKNQWIAGHKKPCREPRQFEEGDYIRLFGIQGDKELNGTLVKLVEKDPNKKGRSLVTNLEISRKILIAETKMEQLHPLK